MTVDWLCLFVVYVFLPLFAVAFFFLVAAGMMEMAG